VDLLQAIVLGFVQGITEFLPISSTAHLRIVPAMLGWEDPGAAFTAVTQLGTMAAILVYFRADIARILVAWVRGLRNPEIRKTLDSRLGWYVLVGTIPIGIFGLAFRHQIENGALAIARKSLFLVMLECQDRRRYQDGGLFSIDTGFACCAYGDLRFSKPHIPADQPVHG